MKYDKGDIKEISGKI